MAGPQAWATVERGPPGRNRSERNPACHQALWQGVMEALDRIPRPKQDRGEDVLPQSLWRTHRRKRPGSPNRRNPDPHRTDEPHPCPRNGRDCSCRLMPAGKGRSCLRSELRNNAAERKTMVRPNCVRIDRTRKTLAFQARLGNLTDHPTLLPTVKSWVNKLPMPAVYIWHIDAVWGRSHHQRPLEAFTGPTQFISCAALRR